MNRRDSTPLTLALGIAAVALVGPVLGRFSWVLGLPIGLGALGAAWWLWRQRAGAGAAGSEGPAFETGLRVVEKPLAEGRSRLPHGLRVTISTEAPVTLGIRVVCDAPVLEVEALVQTGRGAAARQGEPPSTRESRQAWLFVARNTPRLEELFLRVDLFANQPVHLLRVEQIRPGGKVALPEWKELEQSLAESAAEPAPPAAPPAPATVEATLATHVPPPTPPKSEPVP